MGMNKLFWLHDESHYCGNSAFGFPDFTRLFSENSSLFFNCLVAVFQLKIAMIPVVVLALCVTAALSAPSLDPQLDEHWNLWKDWHSKKYHEVTCVC